MSANATAVALETRPQPGLKKLLFLLFAAYFTFGMVLNVVGVIIPVLIAEYQLTLFMGGLLAFAFYISFGVCSVPAGLAADRFGAKPLVLAGMGLMAAGCAAMPLAGSFATTTFFAFAIGSGVALLQTAGNALIEHLDRPDNYHRNLTLTIGFCGIGAFTGPILLSALQSAGQPWQRLYEGFAVFCFIQILFLVSSRFPQIVSEEARKVRIVEIVRLLRHPIAVTYFFGVFFYVGAEVGSASWIVKFFEQVHGIGSVGHGPRVLGLTLPAVPVLTVSLYWGLQGVGRLISGPGITKWGARPMLRIYALGALLSLAFSTVSPPRLAAVCFAACGFFTSILITLLFSGAIHSFSQAQGAISGLLVTASIGGAIIPPLVGLTADHFSMRIAMMVPAFCFTFVLAVALVGKAQYD